MSSTLISSDGTEPVPPDVIIFLNPKMPPIPSHRKKHIPMKKITAVFFAACIIAGIGCHWVGVRGNGHLKTDQRTISAFVTVDASGAFTIEMARPLSASQRMKIFFPTSITRFPATHFTCTRAKTFGRRTESRS